MVRQICSVVSGHFQLLLTQQEARQRQQQQQQQQQVKAKMLKRLSVDKTEQKMKSEKPSPPKPQPEHAPDVSISTDIVEQPSSYSDIPELPGQDWILRDWSTSPQPSPSTEGELLEEIGRQFMAITKEPSRRIPASQMQGPRLKRLSVGPEGGSLSKKRRQPSRPAPSRPAPSRPLDKVKQEDLSRSQDSLGELVPPIQSTKIEKHDGAILIQPLEDTTGIKVPDSPELYIAKSKTRLSLEGSFPPSSSNSQTTIEPMEVAPVELSTAKAQKNNAPAPPEPMDTETHHLLQATTMEEGQSGAHHSPQDTTVEESQSGTHHSPQDTTMEEGQTDSESKQGSVLRTSLLLESKEEGDKETRIDGDASGTILLQTVMSEKETAIVGREGKAVLLPASNLQQYEQEEEK